MFACAGMRASPRCPLLNSVCVQGRLRRRPRTAERERERERQRRRRVAASVNANSAYAAEFPAHRAVEITRRDVTIRSAARQVVLGFLIDIKATDRSTRPWVRLAQTSREGGKKGIGKRRNVFSLAKRRQNGTFEEHRTLKAFIAYNNNALEGRSIRLSFYLPSCDLKWQRNVYHA